MIKQKKNISQFLKRLAYWTLPQGLFVLLKSARNRDLSIGNIMNKKNSQFKNLHDGKRCFILATGPSIKTQDLKFLNEEHTIAVSNFFVHEDCKAIAPHYYCIAPYHLPIQEESWKSWIRELFTVDSLKDTIFFFGSADRRRVLSITNVTQERVRFINFYYANDEKKLDKIDLTRGLPAPQSVSIMALYVAIYLGFKEIYLLGCDHDWILNVNSSRHFYPENKNRLMQDGYSEWFGEDFSTYCNDYVQLWNQYKLLKRYCAVNERQIFNSTNGGLLDVFERKNFEDVIKNG